MRFRLVLLVTLLPIVSPACGKEDATGTAAASGPVSAADFPARYVQTYCRTLAPCCGQDAVKYDEAYCLEHEKLGEKFASYAQENPYLAYDPVGGGKCLDAMAAAGCAIQDDVGTPGCEGVLVGKIPLGEKCFERIHCAPQAGQVVDCTGIQTEDGPGVCGIVATNIGAGAPCGFDRSTQCAKGLSCVPVDPKDPKTSVCTPPPALGEKCNYDCAVGARCDNGGSNVCVAKLALGEACFGDTVCVEGSFCDHAGEKMCKPLLQRGAPCGLPFHCASGFCEGGLCRGGDVHECSGDVDEDDPSEAAPVGTGGPKPAPPG